MLQILVSGLFSNLEPFDQQLLTLKKLFVENRSHSAKKNRESKLKAYEAL